MTRAQAYTLEGIISGILLVAAVLYGLQAVDTAPYTGGTNERSADLLQQELQDAMTVIQDAGGFRRAASCITGGGAPDPRLAKDESENATTLGTMLRRTFFDQSYSYSVEFSYWESATSPPTGQQHTSTVVESGTPGSDAVVATRQVALYNDTTLREWDEVTKTCQKTDGTVETASSFYAPYVGDGTELYNVVHVHVTVWRGR